MLSRNSWLNKEIIKLIFRNTGWLGIVYLIGLFFALPLNVMMQLSNEENPFNLTYGHMFQLNFVLQAGLMMAIPVLLSVFLFRYLHVRHQADLIHSLPVKRERLFFHYSLSGLVMLIVPVILTALSMLLIAEANELGSHYQASDIFQWALITILMDVLFYVSGIVVAMLTGVSVIQAVITYVLLLFPSGIYILMVMNLKNFLYGFPQEYFFNVQAENFSPIIKAGMFYDIQLSITEVMIYLVLIVALYLVSLMLYKKRNLESASHALAFSVLKPIFKFFLIFALMLISGAYFSEVQGKLSWTLFGYAGGFFIGYLLAEMILQKTWRVNPRLKELVGFALFIAFTLFVFQLGFKDYETYIPKTDEIERIYFGDNIYFYLDEYNDEPVKYLTTKENIKSIRDLHNAVLSQKAQGEGMDNLVVVYELKNGDKAVREYRMNRGEYDSYLESIYESTEYKKAYQNILSVKTEDVDKLTVTARGPFDKRVSLTDESLIKEALDILQREVMEEPYESMIDRRDNLYDIEVLLENDKRIYAAWKPSYKTFEKWMDKEGLLEKVEVTADDVSKVLVFKRKDHQAAAGMNVDFHQSVATLEEEGKTIDIKSEERIEDLLKASSWAIESEFMVAFYFKGQDYPDIKGFTEGNIPEYVKEELSR